MRLTTASVMYVAVSDKIYKDCYSDQSLELDLKRVIGSGAWIKKLLLLIQGVMIYVSILSLFVLSTIRYKSKIIYITI